MLTQFVYKRTFNRITVSIYVDCETKTAEITLKEGRLIRKTYELTYCEVSSPELCRDYFAGEITIRAKDGTHGTISRLEDWDRCAGLGLFPFERAVA
jgi:hypothetical protein